MKLKHFFKFLLQFIVKCFVLGFRALHSITCNEHNNKECNKNDYNEKDEA